MPIERNHSNGASTTGVSPDFAADKPAATSYDAVPYQSHAFAQTQPDKLAVIAKLFGLDPVLPSRARVLELGCAAGGNLIPLAARFPNAQFVGIDLSAVEVAHGREQVAALGLTNIQIEQQSITDFSSDQPFDYIIAHGVYSWVPVPVQEAIMQLCRANLSDRGVAYISYNVYPGWKGREVVRDAMMFHAGVHQDPTVKLQQARGIIQYLEKISDPKSSFGAMIREEAKLIVQAPDYYLFHEHLEENNRPCYFKEFIAEAQRHGLGFLGEASIAEMAPQRLGAEIAETLSKLSAGNILATEQYMDFFKNRMFRQTLLVKKEALTNVSRNMNIDSLLPFYVSSPVQPAPAQVPPSPSPVQATSVQATPSPVQLVDAQLVSGATKQPLVNLAPGNQAPAGKADEAPLAKDEAQYVIGANTRIRTSNPFIKAFLTELISSYPRPVGLAALRDKVIASLPSQPVSFAPAAKPAVPNPRAEMDDLIVRMAIDGWMSLHIETFEIGRADASVPKAFSVAVNLAKKKQPRVPNLRHESVNLSPVEIEVLALMDGQRNRAQLIEGIISKSHSGAIRVERDKQLVTDEAALRPLVESLLSQTLAKFERCALLS